MEINESPSIFKRKVQVSLSPNQIHLLERVKENESVQVKDTPKSPELSYRQLLINRTLPSLGQNTCKNT